MIFIDRKRIPVPSILGSSKVRALKSAAQKFFTRPKQSRLQERFDFQPAVLKELRPQLTELFRGKCAYCESLVGVSSHADIDQFRPKVEAVGLIAKSARSPKSWIGLQKGESDRDGYWWLTYEWENLYYACQLCNRNKRNQFPVIGKRAAPGTVGDALRAELALLLDPCVDRPEQYLIFDTHGVVACAKPKNEDTERFQNMDRGAITIDVFGLNRPDLVSARKQAADYLREEWATVTMDKSFGHKAESGLVAMLAPTYPYVGMRRQLIRQWSVALLKQIPEASRPRLLAALGDLAPEPSRKKAPARAKCVAGRKRKPAAKKVVRTLHPRKQRTIGFIKSVKIQNFKAIRDLKLQLSTGSDERIGWKVMLGENGTGKSSILQAIALALMGPKFLRRYLREFRLRPRDLLRKTRGDQTTASAQISIEFSTGRKTLLRIFPNRFEYPAEPPEGLFLRGYGATRLLPRRNTPRVRVKKGIATKVTNLFDPAKPVFNTEGWLAGLNRKEFGSAALSLKDLLNLPGLTKLSVKLGAVVVPANGLKHSLDELSAGYESILVMAADIMAGKVGQNQDFRHAPGIVLLDEIDAHLHPRWKMKIVESLRRTFASMQFLVTTHEPLCLRGVEKGEAIVLERTGKEISVLEDLPAPSSLRVDQLLTSNFFGLGSTIDPKMEKEFSQYYELLGKQQRLLKTDERLKRDQLRDKLAKYEHRLMTDTPREALLYEAIDEYVAKDVSFRGAEREKLPALREETKLRVAQMWKEVGQSGGSST